MMDIVLIDQLTVMTSIGVYDWEQAIRQKLVIDLEMAWNCRQAALTDDVNNCLNYAEVSELVITYVEQNSFILIERVAENIASLLMQHFAIPWLKITVYKPNAVAAAKRVGVRIERGQRPREQ